MHIQPEILSESLSLFLNNEKGVFWQGKFVSLSTDLSFSSQEQKIFQRPSELVKFIVQDIWNIGTIIHRLSWFRSAPIDKEFREHMWFPYARVDIEHFHSELRSIMDYAGEIVSHIAIKSGQVPKSFRKLQKYVTNDQGKRTRIGEDLAIIVESAQWFPSLRGIRDSLIHTGGATLVFENPEEGILFQVYNESLKDLIDTNILMYNENVVHFDRYAAFYLANLFVFLEKLAENIYENHAIKPVGLGGATISSPGFDIIFKWINNFKELIEKG